MKEVFNVNSSRWAWWCQWLSGGKANILPTEVLLSLAKKTKCSGQLNGSQMDKLIGRVEVGGGSLRKMGSTINVQDVCTPISTWHAPAIVSPWSGYETSEQVILQPLDLREVTKDVTHWLSWSGRTVATTTWRSCNERNWATMVPWSCQNVEMVSLSLKRREWMT